MKALPRRDQSSIHPVQGASLLQVSPVGGGGYISQREVRIWDIARTPDLFIPLPL